MKIPAAGLPLAMRTAKLSTQNINETNTAQKLDHPVYESRSKNDINVLFSSWFGMAVAWQLDGTMSIALHGSAICINFFMGVVQ